MWQSVNNAKCVVPDICAFCGAGNGVFSLENVFNAKRFRMMETPMRTEIKKCYANFSIAICKCIGVVARNKIIIKKVLISRRGERRLAQQHVNFSQPSICGEQKRSTQHESNKNKQSKCSTQNSSIFCHFLVARGGSHWKSWPKLEWHSVFLRVKSSNECDEAQLWWCLCFHK